MKKLRQKKEELQQYLSVDLNHHLNNLKEVVLFRHANKSIELIGNFLNSVDQGVIIFKEGVRNYLCNNRENFPDNLRTLSALETEADIIKRKTENILFTQSLMPQLRGDMLNLLEELDNIPDLTKTSLFRFDFEIPFFPADYAEIELIHKDFTQKPDMFFLHQ